MSALTEVKDVSIDQYWYFDWSKGYEYWSVLIGKLRADSLLQAAAALRTLSGLTRTTAGSCSLSAPLMLTPIMLTQEATASSRCLLMMSSLVAAGKKLVTFGGFATNVQVSSRCLHVPVRWLRAILFVLLPESFPHMRSEMEQSIVVETGGIKHCEAI